MRGSGVARRTLYRKPGIDRHSHGAVACAHGHVRTRPAQRTRIDHRQEEIMHALLGTLAGLLLFAGLASAGGEKKDSSAPPARTTECTTQASDRKLSGDARKQFMAECLKTPAASRDDTGGSKASRAHKSAETGHSSQAEKMKTCNQEATAKNLHKDERRQFMSECLKGDKKS